MAAARMSCCVSVFLAAVFFMQPASHSGPPAHGRHDSSSTAVQKGSRNHELFEKKKNAAEMTKLSNEDVMSWRNRCALMQEDTMHWTV
jgi:hypothetical protein